MPREKDTQGAALEKVTSSPAESVARHADSEDRSGAGSEARGADRVLGGLERIREILLGDVLAELERRLARIDSQLANRTSELHQDARLRTDVLEAHVRKEIEAVSARAAQLEQRLARVEERMEAQVARIERESRQQLLDQAKSFLDELERVRHQLRSAIVRELGLEPGTLEEGSPHDGAWAAPH